jgi:hypothetical protein
MLIHRHKIGLPLRGSHSQLADCLLDLKMGSTMAAADKEFSSAVLALADTLGLLIGLIDVSYPSNVPSNA